MGEVHALFMFSQTLAKTNPNPLALAPQFEVAVQLGLANVETAPVPDAVVEGYQFAVEGLRQALAANQGNIPPQK